MTDLHLNTRFKSVISPVISHVTPLEIQKGRGCYLTTTDGKNYLDFTSGVAVASTGHCHPKVVKAIQKQAETLIHPCIGIAFYEPPIKLAERLLPLLGPTPKSVFFCQSGTEANEAALKLAKYVSKKPRILAFNGGFHGRTLGALSVTSKKAYRDGYEPLLDKVDFIDFPNRYRNKWNESDPKKAADHYIEELNTYFNTLPSDLGAVIIEPMLGEGGYVPAPKDYLIRLRELCTRHNVFLIFDEIQTGIGRSGDWSLGLSYGVEPDIITLAKGLGSGMPIGACVAKKELMEQWKPGAHGGTYGGNPVSCSAALATVDIIDEVLPMVAKHGSHALSFLMSKLSDHPLVGSIRGRGLMIGIEFVKDKITQEPHPDIIKTIISACLDDGLMVLSCGVYSNVIRLVPPLIISKEDLEKGLTIFTGVINALH